MLSFKVMNKSQLVGMPSPTVFDGICRPSYIEGRLRLAENRERQRGKGATPSGNAAPDGVPTPEERAAAEKAAEANMARLLQEEDAAKVSVCPSASTYGSFQLFVGVSSSAVEQYGVCSALYAARYATTACSGKHMKCADDACSYSQSFQHNAHALRTMMHTSMSHLAGHSRIFP